MRRLSIAIRVFFIALFDAEVAGRIDEILARRGMHAPNSVNKPPKSSEPPPKLPARNEALTLLASLQREARFVDFVKEALGGYSDAQVGAVARDVHRDCGVVLDRLFALSAVVVQDEGSEVDVPADFDAGRYRIMGNVIGQPPYRGHLIHHGWEASKCELPAWSGRDTSARIVSPAEVELK